MTDWLETFDIENELKIINKLISQEVVEPVTAVPATKTKKIKTIKMANPNLFEPA